MHAEAKARRLRTIDATCPLVSKVHLEAKRFAADDLDIILIGHEGHEEVVGTTGQAPEHMHLVDGIEEAAAVQVRDPARVAYLSQTTLSVDETNVTVDALRQRFPLLQGPPSADICYATQNRQVGGEGDRRGLRPRAGRRVAQLLELGAAGRGGAGCWCAARRTSSTTPPRSTSAWLDGVTTVGRHQRGVRPGGPRRRACSPGWPAGLRRRQEVEAAEEHLLFALPPELRRDLRVAGLPDVG